jgi:hypothetical protein
MGGGNGFCHARRSVYRIATPKTKRLAHTSKPRGFEQKVAKRTKGTEALDLHWCAIAALSSDDFAYDAILLQTQP